MVHSGDKPNKSSQRNFTSLTTSEARQLDGLFLVCLRDNRSYSDCSELDPMLLRILYGCIIPNKP